MTTQREALQLALDWMTGDYQNLYSDQVIAVIKEALAQPEQEPVGVRFPRDRTGAWEIDPVFLARVESCIDSDTHHSFCPDRENIESALLALELVPPEFYASPPKRKPLTDDEFISMVDSAGLVIDPSLAFEIKEMVETAHGITGGAQ